MSSPAGPVSPSQAAERWPIRSEEHHRWGAHESLLTSIARVNASSTSIFRNQGDAILALPSVGILCAQLLLSVRRPFGSQSPARALCVRRSFNLGDLQAAFHRDCRCAEPRFPRWRLFPAVFLNSQLVASPARLTPSPRSLSSLDEPVLHRHDGLCKQFQDNLGG